MCAVRKQEAAHDKDLILDGREAGDEIFVRRQRQRHRLCLPPVANQEGARERERERERSERERSEREEGQGEKVRGGGGKREGKQVGEAES
jgi:hypothetical protein